ncbi:putative ABC transporter [Aureobasidium pullulans]|uniref:Putative ABC transporter n=1 Tax=Aureobasidium pullulans TaxID=5580 RepID=A0A4S9L8X8_AURPU|nr:putative ABC transporter [Aureobasidium pullulans]
MSNSTLLLNAARGCGEQHSGPASCDGSFDFTLLFEQTFLSIVPSSIFLCCLPISLFKLYKSAPKFKASTFHAFKLVKLSTFRRLPCSSADHRQILTGLLTITKLVLLIAWTTQAHTQTTATTPALCLGLIVSSAMVFLSALTHTRPMRPSSLASVYFLFSAVFDAAQVRTLFLNQISTVLSSLMCLAVALKIALCMSESWNKRSWLPLEYETLSPEATSGIVSRSLLWWLNPFFLVGFRTLFTQEDIYAIDPDMRSQGVGRKLEELFRQGLGASTPSIPYNHTNSSATLSSLWALPKACFRCFWMYIAAMIPTRLALVGFTYAQTFLFTRAIDYLSHQKHSDNDTGYGLIAATFMIYVGIAVSTALYQQQITRIMTKLRGALITMIYDRMLVISDGANKDGAALTLISTDTITRVLSELNESWARIIEVAVGIGLLYRQVGAVCIVPVILTLVASQAQTWISKRIGSRRKDWNAATQKRVNATAAVLGSIQSVKMSGLMNPASGLLHSLRISELRMLASLSHFIIGMNAIAVIPSVWAPVATFVVYAIKARIDGSVSLDISQAFTSIALLNLVTTPTAKLLAIMPLWAQCLGCFERLQQYFELPLYQDPRSLATISDLLEPESNTDGNNESGIEMIPLQARGTQATPLIICSNMDVSFSTDGPIILTDVNLEIKPGSVTTITGPTGSGKTILLKAILGEAPILKGKMTAPTNSISYCSQTPWMVNTTIRGYIAGLNLGARAVDESWYNTVVHACDLTRDIASLPDRDNTQLGSKGVSLSGGQKARLALARAVYARKQLILMDDVFSALDVNTEEVIIRRLLGQNGLLPRLRSTVVIVTHSHKVLRIAEQVIILSKDGRVAYQGNPTLSPELELKSSAVDRPSESTNADAVQMTNIQPPKSPSTEDKEDLARKTGEWTIYKFYFRNFQKKYLAMFIACSMGAAFSSRFSQVWLKWWTTGDGSNIGFYLAIYAFLALAQTCFSNLNMWVVFLKMIPDSAISMHQTLLTTVAGAASSVFCQTDSGAILNRFAQDMYLVVGTLPTSLIASGNTLCETIASLAMISTGASYMGITIPFVMLAIYLVQKVYLQTSRQLRLLEIEARSPIYSHFLETIEGVVSIRAFGWEEEAKETHNKLLDIAQSPYYLLSCIQRWLKLVLDLIVAALAVLVVALAVSQRGTTSAGLLGVALTNILGFSQSLTRLVTEWTTLETSLGAIARIRSFATTTEQENSSIPHEATEDFVTQGAVRFSDVFAKYTSGPGPYDLDGVSFEIPPGTKVAICGRTGSGKSSLMLALFRLLPLRHGSIFIDDTDVKDVNLDVLRSGIIAIPQQPFLLPGTVRENLDPEDELSDVDLFAAIEKVHLLELINSRGGLDTDIDQQSLSQGQAQLLCLARAILRKSKLVVLDEATSSLDAETDAIIRGVLNTSFKHCTVISIAHGTTTIFESEMVIMMDVGSVAAIGTPDKLRASNAHFRELCGLV